MKLFMFFRKYGLKFLSRLKFKDEYSFTLKRKRNFNNIYFLIAIALVCILFKLLFISYTKTLILMSLLLNIFCIINLNNIKRHMEIYIENKFNFENSLEKDRRLKLIQSKSRVNRLIILDEEGNDREIYEFSSNEYIIGKSSLNYAVDIDLSTFRNEELVSRRHARVYKKENNFYIVDEGSKNGTSILKMNRRKIKLEPFKEEKIIKGDILNIARIMILVN